MKTTLKTYFISGIWTDLEGNATHYCVHQYTSAGVSKMKKLTREQLFGVLTRVGTAVFVFTWEYKKGCFTQGQEVKLVQGVTINTVPPKDEHRDLKHLINLAWFE